jgi:uncharacterized membrane protein YtjA (UPF0391 family)
MLGWALAFFIVSLIAAVFGYSGIAAGAAGVVFAFFSAYDQQGSLIA